MSCHELVNLSIKPAYTEVHYVQNCGDGKNFMLYLVKYAVNTEILWNIIAI